MAVRIHGIPDMKTNSCFVAMMQSFNLIHKITSLRGDYTTGKEITTMKNTTEQTAPRMPRDITLERLAKLPEDVKKMALAYAQGVSNGRKLTRSKSA